MPIDVEAFYRRYGSMVFRRCLTLLGDEQDAMDAMHDVFVQVARRRERLDDYGSSSLLFRISTNVCLNRIRTRRRHPEVLDVDLLARLACAPEAETVTNARLFLQRLFARQHESTRVMAVMHLLDGMTLEQVAEETGMSVSGVRKRLRALRACAVELEGV